MNSGVLSDASIRRLAENGLIEPFNDKYLQPNSYDVHLAADIQLECCPPDGWLLNTPYFEERKVPKCGFLKIPPKTSFLGSIQERLTLPSNVCAQFFLCSTDGRLLRDHALAGWIDSGYYGNITTEFTNNARHTYWEISEGDRIGQIVFYWSDPVERPYNGRYQGDKSVALARFR